MTKTVAEEAALNRTMRTVTEEWRCRWQEVAGKNDDGIDGLIFYQKKSVVTDTIYVQVKGGKGYRKSPKAHPNHIGVNVGKRYIQKHKSRWMSYPGPVILVYLDGDNSVNHTAYWTDLKKSDSYTTANPGYILVPKDQIFDVRAKKKIHSLTASRAAEMSLQALSAYGDELPHLDLNGEPLKKSSFNYYKRLRSAKITPACTELESIEFSRVGWRHITRKTRSRERIIQSLMLLPIAKHMIEGVERFEIVDRRTKEDVEKNTLIHFQTLLLRARVSFSFRYPATINLVLRRKIEVHTDDVTDHPTVSQKVWFYSIYEAQRKRELVR
jgi:hypothetical protein